MSTIFLPRVSRSGTYKQKEEKLSVNTLDTIVLKKIETANSKEVEVIEEELRNIQVNPRRVAAESLNIGNQMRK